MSVEQFLRTMGVLTCVYTVGAFVTSTTIASINVAGHSQAVLCAPQTCPHVAESASMPDLPELDAVTNAALALVQSF